ncbi:MAG: LacI family DNA-binding transcriptional regulator [Flavobacteriaceae bacterium]|nr:LacI family DNA-binding transcriptional regulator [Flavobacteriaceae bacterium]
MNNYPDVGEKTKQKVLELAASLKFIPNSVAQNLRQRESKLIGFITPNAVHYFFSNVLNGVIHTAQASGYSVIVLCSEDKVEFEKEQLEILINKKVDGILLSLTDHTTTYEHIKKVVAGKMPLVLYDKISKFVNCSKVTINDRKIAHDATQYLIDRGCKRIAHIRGALNSITIIDRYLGYKKALKENRIEADESMVYECSEPTIEEGRRIAELMLKDEKKIDGVLAFTDALAIGVILRLNELGVKIPEEVSVIGFSNSIQTRVVSPSLTTIDQHGFDMGKKAVETLCERNKGH